MTCPENPTAENGNWSTADNEGMCRCGKQFFYSGRSYSCHLICDCPLFHDCEKCECVKNDFAGPTCRYNVCYDPKSEQLLCPDAGASADCEKHLSRVRHKKSYKPCDANKIPTGLTKRPTRIRSSTTESIGSMNPSEAPPPPPPQETQKPPDPETKPPGPETKPSPDTIKTTKAEPPVIVTQPIITSSTDLNPAVVGPSTDDGDSAGLGSLTIFGIVLGLIVFLIVILALLLFFFCYRGGQSQRSSTRQKSDVEKGKRKDGKTQKMVESGYPLGPDPGKKSSLAAPPGPSSSTLQPCSITTPTKTQPQEQVPIAPPATGDQIGQKTPETLPPIQEPPPAAAPTPGVGPEGKEAQDASAPPQSPKKPMAQEAPPQPVPPPSAGEPPVEDDVIQKRESPKAQPPKVEGQTPGTAQGPQVQGQVPPTAGTQPQGTAQAPTSQGQGTQPVAEPQPDDDIIRKREGPKTPYQWAPTPGAAPLMSPHSMVLAPNQPPKWDSKSPKSQTMYEQVTGKVLYTSEI